MDIQATNFDLDADISCDSCCVYPQFKIRILHQYSDTDTTYATLSLNRNYLIQDNANLKISNLQFYLSDFKLIQNNNLPIGVEDTLRVVWQNDDLNVENDTFTVKDNFALIDRSRPTTYNIGFIEEREVIRYDSLQFVFGLRDTINRSLPTAFENTHPLYLDIEDGLYNTENPNYAFLRMEIQAQETYVKSTTSEYSGVVRNHTFLLDSEIGYQTITIPADFTTVKGFDTTITLRIDYRKWFESVNLLSNSIAADNLIKGIKSSFSVVKE